MKLKTLLTKPGNLRFFDENSAHNPDAAGQSNAIVEVGDTRSASLDVGRNN